MGSNLLGGVGDFLFLVFENHKACMIFYYYYFFFLDFLPFF